MTRTLEFYYDYGSPYSYLADSQVEAIATTESPLDLAMWKASIARERRLSVEEMPNWVKSVLATLTPLLLVRMLLASIEEMPRP